MSANTVKVLDYFGDTVIKVYQPSPKLKKNMINSYFNVAIIHKPKLLARQRLLHGFLDRVEFRLKFRSLFLVKVTSQAA